MAVLIIPLITFERKCSRCGVRKVFTDYYKDSSVLIRSWCKSCSSEYDTKERCKVIKNARNKIYMREYYKRPEVRMRYRSSGRLAWRRRYHQKFKDDPCFKLTNAMRSSLRQALLNKKSYSTFKILGYSLSDLMKHLENLFQPGMLWSNYGKWHVDHKIPLSRFNYTSPDDPQFKQCWALNNLQPLWAADNIRKFNH